MTSADLIHAPLGVNDAMLPFASTASTCTVPGPQGCGVKRSSAGNNAALCQASPGRSSSLAFLISIKEDLCVE